MKKLIVFIIITLGVILLSGLYFEYIISRPMDKYIQSICTVVIFVIDIAYFRYLVKSTVSLFKIDPNQI